MLRLRSPGGIFNGSVAQPVRAPSLYLGGRWFESIQTHQELSAVAEYMLFVTIFLAILALVFIGYGARGSNKDMITLGVVFLIAAAGAGLITYFAFSAF